MAAQRDARTARNRTPRGVDGAKRLRVVVERLEEETTLWQEFLRAHRTIIDKMAEQMMRDHNLPLEWFDVLIHLAEVPDGRLRQRALRDRLLMSESGVSRLLLRMEQGASLPAHDHPTAEECVVLEGEVWLGDVHCHAGDYHRAPRGKPHGALRTDGGCLLYVRTGGEVGALL